MRTVGMNLRDVAHFSWTAQHRCATSFYLDCAPPPEIRDAYDALMAQARGPNATAGGLCGANGVGETAGGAAVTVYDFGTHKAGGPSVLGSPPRVRPASAPALTEERKQKLRDWLDSRLDVCSAVRELWLRRRMVEQLPSDRECLNEMHASGVREVPLPDKGGNPLDAAGAASGAAAKAVELALRKLRPIFQGISFFFDKGKGSWYKCCHMPQMATAHPLQQRLQKAYDPFFLGAFESPKPATKPEAALSKENVGATAKVKPERIYAEEHAGKSSKQGTKAAEDIKKTTMGNVGATSEMKVAKEDGTAKPTEATKEVRIIEELLGLSQTSPGKLGAFQCKQVEEDPELLHVGHIEDIEDFDEVGGEVGEAQEADTLSDGNPSASGDLSASVIVGTGMDPKREVCLRVETPGFVDSTELSMGSQTQCIRVGHDEAPLPALIGEEPADGASEKAVAKGVGSRPTVVDYSTLGKPQGPRKLDANGNPGKENREDYRVVFL
ncbi:unnamed protein product [Amoebophrya sp. A25]|nr:unnamed protein product [Amoebophrya sp. A25]|eukprot:GSA25T00021677001.1